MKRKSIGSSFDDFLKEEGIYEEAVKTAKERGLSLILQKKDGAEKNILQKSQDSPIQKKQGIKP